MKKETAKDRIRISPTTRLRLKRFAEKIAKQRNIILVSYDTAVTLLLDEAK